MFRHSYMSPNSPYEKLSYPALDHTTNSMLRDLEEVPVKKATQKTKMGKSCEVLSSKKDMVHWVLAFPLFISLLILMSWLKAFGPFFGPTKKKQGRYETCFKNCARTGNETCSVERTPDSTKIRHHRWMRNKFVQYLFIDI